MDRELILQIRSLGRSVAAQWKTELAWLAGAVLLAVALSALFDDPWLYLALTLSVYSARHLRHLARLHALLSGNRKAHPPFPPGPWGVVFGEVRRLQTGSRKRKRRLAQFLTRFREAVTAMPDAAIILGKDGNIEWANPAAEKLLGVPWPMRGRRYLLRAVDHPVLQDYLKNGDFKRPLEFTSPVNKAAVLSLRITAFGKKHQRLLMARDITRIYHLDKVRRDFVSNISHELRTPLTVITGFLETLSDSPETCPGWDRSLELMREQAGRMQALIDDLLTLSRFEMSEEQATNEQSVAIHQLLASIVHEAEALSGENSHVIQLDASPAVGLKGNAQELRSIFSNLVYNAIRHTPGRTQVRVAWHPDSVGARFSVTDTGEGIPARHLPRLTERFYRVDEGRSRESGGTGLGLAIVKHALNRYDAKLEVTSEVGKGSTFSCWFPPERLAHLEAPEEAVRPG